MTDKKRAREVAKEGLEALKTGDIATARQKFSTAVRLDDTLAEAWYYLGRYTEEPQKQMEYFQRALQLKPDYEKAQQALQAVRAKRPVQTGPLSMPTAPSTPPASQRAATKTFSDDDLFGESESDAATSAATADPHVNDDPFAGLDLPPKPRRTTATEDTGSRVNEAARKLQADVMSELSGENRKNLIRAWLAALTFDSEHSYEAYRGRTNPVVTAIMIGAVLAVAPPISLVLTFVFSGLLDYTPFSEVISFVLRSLLGGVILGVQTVIALYVGSLVASSVARRQFQSNVSTQEQFGLGGLLYVPLVIATLLLIVLSAVIAPLFNGTFAASISFTVIAFGLFALIQFVFSNCAIHRVGAWRGFLVTLSLALTAGVITAWLAPISLSLISGGL